MFTKLRNRFLLMNMVIISLIMLVAFFTIYTLTYRNTQNEIKIELHRQSEANVKAGAGAHRQPGKELGGPGREPGGQGRELGEPAKEQGKELGETEPYRERALSFGVLTDENWIILERISRFPSLTEDFYDAAVKRAAAKPVEFGQFTDDDIRWAYSVTSMPGGYSIVFMDVTAQQQILTNLISAFSLVALVMLGVIYMASRYFAGKSIAPVKEAFEKQKRFIADASHELKTPLTVINTNVDVMLNNGEDTVNGQAKWLHRIKGETERMKKLTNDLLYLTEMDDARSSPLHIPFNLSEAVESVVLSMEAVIYEQGLSLDYAIEPGLTVNGSSEQLRQVTMILLDNAVKYNYHKGAIRLELRKVQGCVQLSVSNTGPGIPAEHVDKIFDRFYRADPSRSRQHGGYGLGLAIAKSIVDQHKGKIYARSSQEETTFFVQLG